MNVWIAFVITLALAVGVGALALVFETRRKNKIAPHLTALAPRGANLLVVLMFAAYCLVFGTLALLRHASFHSGGYDLGIFDQAIWNSLNGRLLENSIMIDSPSLLGHHWSPLLIGFVPLYAVWSDVRALLLAQTILIASGAFPLYWFARQRLGALLALVVVALYFLYPALEYVNLFEFHEIAPVIPLLAFALFFLLNHRLVPFLVCLVLTLLLKEEMAFVAAAFGIYLVVVERRITLGIVLTLASIVWAYAAVSYVIPYFYGTAYGGNYFFVERYTYLGKTVSEIIQTALTQPWLVLEQLVLPRKIEFVFQLLVPLVFIPLLGFEIFALALPTLAYLLSSDFPSQSSIRFQYTAPLIPFLFFAFVLGLQRLTRWGVFSKLEPAVAQLILAVLVLTSGLTNYFFQAPGPLSLSMDASQYIITDHTRLGYQLLAMIPPRAAVMADSNLVPHLSQRQVIYQTAVVPNLRDIDYLLSDDTLPIHADYESIWRDVLPLPFFETLVEQDGYILKKRAAVNVSQPLMLEFDDGITLMGYDVKSPQPARRGDATQLVLAWRANRAVASRYAVFVHLLDEAGNLWAQDDHEPGNGWFRTDWWQAGDETLDGYALALPAYMPPGKYTLTAGLYRLDNGARLSARHANGDSMGDEPAIGLLEVGNAFTPIAANQIEIAQPKRARVQGLNLLGFTTIPETLSNGQALHLGLYWRASRSSNAVWNIKLALLRANGTIAFESARTTDVVYPTDQWDQGEILLQWHTLPLPQDLPAGAYQIGVLLENESGKRVDTLILAPLRLE